VNIKEKYSAVEFAGVENIFDLSVYDPNSSKHIPDNKGILGTLKDEYGGTEITKFICLKSKCYIVVLANGKIAVKNKGVSGSHKLKIEEFEGILEEKIDDINVTQFSIKSFDHKVHTVEYIKKILSNGGDRKRVQFCNDNVLGLNKYETKAIGHYKTIDKTIDKIN
jgi:hypothetical protein